MARAACKFIVHFSMSFCTTRPTRASFRKNGTLLSCRPYRCWACAIAQQLDESNRRRHIFCVKTPCSMDTIGCEFRWGLLAFHFLSSLPDRMDLSTKTMPAPQRAGYAFSGDCREDWMTVYQPPCSRTSQFLTVKVAMEQPS